MLVPESGRRESWVGNQAGVLGWKDGDRESWVGNWPPKLVPESGRRESWVGNWPPKLASESGRRESWVGNWPPKLASENGRGEPGWNAADREIGMTNQPGVPPQQAPLNKQHNQPRSPEGPQRSQATAEAEPYAPARVQPRVAWGHVTMIRASLGMQRIGRSAIEACAIALRSSRKKTR